MAKSIALPRQPDPIASINITPLIDVMLVLLIMMILTIPIATHKVPIDLPQGPATTTDPVTPHKLTIDAAGQVFWDAKPIADAALPDLLAGALHAQPDMLVHLQTDPDAPYDRFAHVLAMVKRANVTRMAFVGNQALAY